MTTAEELRKYADKALSEGGIMYFLDEHLDALASRAEAEQAEKEKLRELVRELYACSRQCGCDRCGYRDGCVIHDRMHELEVEE